MREPPEDTIVHSLIPREEAEPQFCIGRVALAAFAFAFFRSVRSVRPPTPPCFRGGSQGASPASIVPGVAGDPADGFLAAGVKL